MDGATTEIDGSKVYVVNSGMMGTGLRITHTYSIDDGLLDCFMLDDDNHESLVAAAERFLNVNTATAGEALRPGAAPWPSRRSRTSPCGRTASTSGGRPSRSTSSRRP